MSEQLKPCPFCGLEAHLINTGRGVCRFAVKCVGCGASTGGSAFQNDDFNTRSWNTRPTEAQHRAELEAVLPDEIDLYRMIKASGERSHAGIARAIAQHLDEIMKEARK